MRVFRLLPVVYLLFAPFSSAQEKQPPPNEPPQLWRASASEQDRRVMIQIARPEYVAPRKPVAAEVMQWENMRAVSLGQVRAFAVNGKPVGPAAVLKALAEPIGVPVFVRFHRPLLDPDPFYLAMFREGTIVLVIGAEDLGPPLPVP